MCKHKLEQTTFCACHNLNPNTLSSSKLLPSKQRSTIFFCLWLCKRKLEQIPFCTCHNPNPKTRSSSQLLPTNKECASTPPEAELHKLRFAQCTYSARTVHGTVHATVHGHSARPQNAVNTMGLAFLLTICKKLLKYILFLMCFLIIFGKRRGIYSVLWPCTVTCTVACTVRALYVHCAKHNVCAPLYFHQQNAAILLLEACRHILHWCTMQGTQLWSPIFAHMRSKCCNVASLFVGSSSEDESVFGLGFWHVQKGICSSLRLHIHKRKKTNLLRLCLVGSSFEAASVLGLRFWQMQKGIGSSLYLHIHKPTNLFRVLQKKNSHQKQKKQSQTVGGKNRAPLTAPDANPRAPPLNNEGLPNACWRKRSWNGLFSLHQAFRRLPDVSNIELGGKGVTVSSYVLTGAISSIHSTVNSDVA